MNRLLGQQPNLTTSTSITTGTTTSTVTINPSSASIRSPMSADSIRPMPSQDPSKRSNSPHIAQQALSPSSLPRKPVENLTNRDRNNSASDSASVSTSVGSGSEHKKYQFDETPIPSARNSTNNSSSNNHNMDFEMDPQVKLEDYDWAELEDQFAKRMEAFRAEEDGIWLEWKGWVEIFKAWASTISEHDEERASKRLRTRIAFTQGSEDSLEAKRQHYIKVVQAFESALALLSSRTSAHNFI